MKGRADVRALLNRALPATGTTRLTGTPSTGWWTHHLVSHAAPHDAGRAETPRLEPLSGEGARELGWQRVRLAIPPDSARAGPPGHPGHSPSPPPLRGRF